MIGIVTPKTLLVYRFIKNNPNCIQSDIINFTGERPHTQQMIYKLISFKYVKVKTGKGTSKHYSIDKRKKL